MAGPSPSHGLRSAPGTDHDSTCLATRRSSGRLLGGSQPRHDDAGCERAVDPRPRLHAFRLADRAHHCFVVDTDDVARRTANVRQAQSTSSCGTRGGSDSRRGQWRSRRGLRRDSPRCRVRNQPRAVGKAAAVAGCDDHNVTRLRECDVADQCAQRPQGLDLTGPRWGAAVEGGSRVRQPAAPGHQLVGLVLHDRTRAAAVAPVAHGVGGGWLRRSSRPTGARRSSSRPSADLVVGDRRRNRRAPSPARGRSSPRPSR